MLDANAIRIIVVLPRRLFLLDDKEVSDYILKPIPSDCAQGPVQIPGNACVGLHAFHQTTWVGAGVMVKVKVKITIRAKYRFKAEFVRPRILSRSILLCRLMLYVNTFGTFVRA